MSVLQMCYITETVKGQNDTECVLRDRFKRVPCARFKHWRVARVVAWNPLAAVVDG